MVWLSHCRCIVLLYYSLPPPCFSLLQPSQLSTVIFLPSLLSLLAPSHPALPTVHCIIPSLPPQSTCPLPSSPPNCPLYYSLPPSSGYLPPPIQPSQLSTVLFLPSLLSLLAPSHPALPTVQSTCPLPSSPPNWPRGRPLYYSFLPSPLLALPTGP